VVGKVLYPDGTAPDLFSVGLGYGNGAPFSGSNGAFALDAPAGKTTLAVNGPTFVRKTLSDIDVKGDADTDVGTITVEKGRSIAGRVLGSDGVPVAGAKVMAGPALIGTGAELGSSSIPAGMLGIKSTVSGDDGGYIISGVPGKSLVIAAEADSGRSPAIGIPPGDTSVALDLTLRRFGALEGRITSGGQPVAMAVMASPQQAMRGAFIVQSGDDGAYRFDKLAPDSYMVSTMTPSMMGAGSIHTKLITVEMDQTVHLDIDLPSSGVSVTLHIQGPEGVAIKSAQVVLMSGAIVAHTPDQLYQAIAERGAGSSHSAFIFDGVPAKVDNVEAGAYTLCAIPFPGDINSPSDMMKLRDKMDLLPVACSPATIAATPAAQDLTVASPAPPAL
jgi:hypothetical protein